MNTFQIHLLTNGSIRTTFWIGTDECASLQGLFKDWHTCINVIQSLSILTSDHKTSFWIRITPQNWLILGWQKFYMASLKVWYVPHHSFFYWLCACILYLNVIMNLRNLNSFGAQLANFIFALLQVMIYIHNLK